MIQTKIKHSQSSLLQPHLGLHVVSPEGKWQNSINT